MRRRTRGRRALVRPIPVVVAQVGVAVLFSLVVAAPTSAYADTGVSSVLISNALPGMVEAPAGPLNGALTPSELNSTFGSSGPTSALSQAIANGDVSAYVRTWSNQPPNGAFVQVIAAQFPSLVDASAALAGADHAVSGIHFGHFPAPEIPQAEGFTVIANSEAGIVSENVVQFAKGAVLFDVAAGQVTTAANSGAPELSDADAVQIARQQAALAPGPALGPTDPSANMSSNTAYQAGRYFGVVVLIVLVAGLIVLLIQRLQRRSKRPIAVAEPAQELDTPFPPPMGAGGPVSSLDGSPQVAAAPSTGRSGAALLERPTARKASVFHCSWCGEAVAIGPHVAHDCGRRDRPGIYCMNCGTQFQEGATVCASCGDRKLQ